MWICVLDMLVDYYDSEGVFRDQILEQVNNLSQEFFNLQGKANKSYFLHKPFF